VPEPGQSARSAKREIGSVEKVGTATPLFSVGTMNTTDIHRNGRDDDAAFTLIELLVVIAVVAVLLTLLFPALGRAMDRVETVSCGGNLRQWGVATQLYVHDHGVLPWDGAPNGISTNRAWYADLPPLMGILPYHGEGAWRTNAKAPLGHPLWFCPANPRRSNGNLLFHYCLNRFVNGTGPDSVQARPEDIPEPSRTVWLFDNGKRAAAAGPGNLHTNLHARGANILFLDASVRRVAAPLPNTQTDADPQGPVWRP
jgi:prepilin-type N-terminal cleavage/methylation domain-containing protein/prepilin-type processing-associated H-X9-DG protein